MEVKIQNLITLAPSIMRKDILTGGKCGRSGMQIQVHCTSAKDIGRRASIVEVWERKFGGRDGEMEWR